MPTTLRETNRTARKPHRCGMCSGLIEAGQEYHVSTNVWDGCVYDFRTCAACEKDCVVSEVYDWCGWPSEGVTAEEAHEWAHENRSATGGIGDAARAWLARRDCTCERCTPTEGAE